MKRALALFAFLVPALLSGGAHAAGRWQTFLNPGEVLSVTPRADGVWWASRQGGLYRYDLAADTVTEFHREPGRLASNRLTVLAVDRTGNLWIGTDGSGLSRLAPDGVTWGIVNSFDGLPSDTVLSLAPQGDTLWIGTSKGLALWNGHEISGSLPDPNTVAFDTTFASTSIAAVAVLGDELWLGTRRELGVAHISSGLSDWSRHVEGVLFTDIEGLAADGQRVFAIAGGVAYGRQGIGDAWTDLGLFGTRSIVNTQNTVLIGSSNNLYTWNGVNFLPVPGGPPPGASFGLELAVTQDAGGNYYGAIRDHLYRLPAGGAWTEIFTSFPIGNDYESVLSDGVRAYVSTRQQGVSRWDGKRWRNWPIGQANPITDTTFVNPNFTYSTFLSSNGRKWVACHDQALEEIDDSTEPPHFTHHFLGSTTDEDRHTRAIVGANDLNGGAWFGMFTPDPDSPGQAAAGLDFYDRNGNYANYRDGRRVSGLAVAADSAMWVGYIGGGVETFQPPLIAGGALGNSQLVTGTTGLDVHGIAMYADTAWVLTTTGLRRYRAHSKILITILSLPSALSTPLDPHPMDVTPDGRLWLGTQAGLRVHRRDGTVQDFNAANSPLPGNDVRTVFVERATGVLWIATSQGLARFEPDYVAPPPPALPSLDLKVYPNPAVLNGVGIQLRLAGNASSYEGEIYDLSGRKLRTFQVPSGGRIVWDGRDSDGNLARPGIYFLRARAAGREASARFVLLR